MTDQSERREFIKRMIAVGGAVTIPTVTSFPLSAGAAGVSSASLGAGGNMTGGGGNTTGGNTGGGGNTTGGNTGGGGNTTGGNTGGGGNTSGGNTGGGGNTTGGNSGGNTGGGANTSGGGNTGGGGTTPSSRRNFTPTEPAALIAPVVSAPLTVPAGATFTATGFDWAVRYPVTLRMVPALGVPIVTIGEAMTNDVGSFVKSLSLPDDLPPGAYRLEARARPLVASWSMMVVDAEN